MMPRSDAEEREVCDEDCDEESNEKSNEPPLEFMGSKNLGTRRDLLSEVVQRIKRLAGISRNTYPARSRSSQDGLRGIDSDWYDESTRGRTVVEPATDEG